ncbi:MAG: UDP-N-acetylglucosamine--N-acetylmuramyl-(pentapeptide) pyrophosphoryl-undecaprenol N-acetylglucosamine transferase, partial [Oscillospiraceae bacterium]|nr:UDP-N-acetylglucosamine--N-acetylmuramyl-(pentapeptide) pyrophosphoryl-undecaprenol N-acetylglucosamine transferase [Oscillospiraceae bacterium]
GSLGAGCINDTMAEVLKWHVSEKLEINHIHGYGGMGKESFPAKMQEYHIPMKNNRLRLTEYIHDMDTCMGAADLVVCRSGANALAELQALGKPSILIPSPIVAGNHQYHNAMVLGKAGAGIVMEQKDVTSQGMIDQIKMLYHNKIKLQYMAKNAHALAIPDTEDRIWHVMESLIKSGK